MNISTRKHYIDNLRWIILLILIPYHTAMAWNVWGEPNYIYFEGNRWISSILVFFSPYFMPLLFVLAGVSTKFALQKRTVKEYLMERVKRLLIPLLFGTIVIMPIMTYLADKFNYSYSGGLLQHYTIFFTKYTDLIGADGGFSLGQFWFLLYLLTISILGVGIITLLERFIEKSDKTIPFWVVCLLGLLLPLLSELLSIGGKSLVEYTYLFMLGYYVFADEKIISNFNVLVDIVYNPRKTKFLQIGESLNKKVCGGLEMLVGQAIKSEEIWQDMKIDSSVFETVYDYIEAKI